MFADIRIFSVAGDKYNEDTVVTGNDFLAVVDGASGLEGVHRMPGDTDAQWFSRRTAALLADGLSADTELSDLLTRISGQLRAELDAAGYGESSAAYPSACLSVVRQRGGQLECFLLGDSPVLLDVNGEIRVLRDDVVPLRDQAVIERMTALCRERQFSMPQALEAVRPLLQKNRAERNQPESYWIWEPTGDGIPHAMHYTFPEKAVRHVAVMSDGFFEYYDCFRLIESVGAFFAAVTSRPLDEMGAELRHLQMQDADMRRFPRFKPADDTSVVTARVEGNG